MDLKDYFSREATSEIESVFLIPKSNCAFVNYKSAPACAAALARFHDSRFQGARLICRVRQGFAALGSGVTSMGASPRLRPGDAATNLSGDETLVSPETGTGPPLDVNLSRMPARYFIVKSLAVDDLELSKQNGIWATQVHNEANLNQAYEVSAVYLLHGLEICDYSFLLLSSFTSLLLSAI